MDTACCSKRLPINRWLSTVLPEGGCQEQTLSPEQADAACLSPEQIRTLVEIGLALEKHFGGPQDVEWAEDQEGAIVILQSRPLRVDSSLEREPETGERSHSRHRRFCRCWKAVCAPWEGLLPVRSIGFRTTGIFIKFRQARWS